MDDGKIIPFGGEKQSTSWGDLYRFMFNLELAAPSVRKPEAAFLAIWIYADSDESAMSKARVIVQQLPYSIADLLAVAWASYPDLVNDDSHSPSLTTQMGEHEAMASRFGFSFMFCVRVPELEH